MAGLFPVGSPVSGDDVVDRAAFLDELAMRLLDRHSVLIAAPRRLGKTTVVREVLRRLAARQVYTALVDLSATPTVAQLAERLTVACLANLSGVAAVATTAWEGLSRLVRVPEIRARMHELELSVALRPEAERRPEALLAEALDLPERMAQKAGRPFVIALDEFSEAAGIGGERLLAQLRSQLQLHQHTAFVFLGSRASIMAHLFGARNQPFFRFATPLELPAVPAEAWRDYISRKLAATGRGISGEAIDTILAYTHGHPYDTMLVAYEAHVLAGARPTILPEIAAGACQTASATLAAVFEAELDAAGPRGRAVLGRIATGQPLYAHQASSASTQKTVRALVADGWIRRVGRGDYTITEPMLAHHLRGR